MVAPARRWIFRPWSWPRPLKALRSRLAISTAPRSLRPQDVLQAERESRGEAGFDWGRRLARAWLFGQGGGATDHDDAYQPPRQDGRPQADPGLDLRLGCRGMRLPAVAPAGHRVGGAPPLALPRRPPAVFARRGLGQGLERAGAQNTARPRGPCPAGRAGMPWWPSRRPRAPASVGRAVARPHSPRWRAPAPSGSDTAGGADGRALLGGRVPGPWGWSRWCPGHRRRGTRMPPSTTFKPRRGRYSWRAEPAPWR